MKDADIQKVVVMDDVEDNKDVELLDGWDAIDTE